VDLNALWKAIQAGLQARNLCRFDAIPDQEAVFAPERMTWEAFVDLAAELGVGLIYTATPTFALELDMLGDDGLDDDSRAELRTLRRDAKRYAGQIGEIELCFAHQGMLHLWSIQQPWLQPLMERVADLRGRPGSG
jgi:hypothetical protein